MYISFNNFPTNYNKYIKSNNSNFQSNPNFSNTNYIPSLSISSAASSTITQFNQINKNEKKNIINNNNNKNNNNNNVKKKNNKL